MKKILLALALLLLPLSVWAYVNIDAAVFVAASSQYASNTGATGLPTGSGARSYEFWFKTSNAASQTILDEGTATASGLIEVFVNVFATNDIGIAMNGGSAHWTAANITNGAWHNFIISYPAGGAMTTATVYMDGVSLGAAAGGSGTPNTGAGCIGLATEACNGLGAYVDGQIDDVRIWTRALSSTEATSYFSNPCTFSDGANLVSKFLLDGNFTDSAGSNSLTAVNSPTFTSTGLPYTSCTPAASPFNFSQWFLDY